MAQVIITLTIPDNDIAAATAAFTDVAGLKEFVKEAVIKEIKERQVGPARDAAEANISRMDITVS